MAASVNIRDTDFPVNAKFSGTYHTHPNDHTFTNVAGKPITLTARAWSYGDYKARQDIIARYPAYGPWVIAIEARYENWHFGIGYESDSWASYDGDPMQWPVDRTPPGK